MAEITLLDGGMGQELVRRSGKAPTPLWATQVMVDHPGLVQAIHADYFAAGATVATANSYAIYRDRAGIEALGADVAALDAMALREAQAARAGFGAGRIAGALGPLGATYRSDKHPPLTEALPLYAEKARRLAPGCDLLLIETCASLLAAEAALSGALEAGLPVWLSLTVDDGDGSRLRSGEPLQAVLPLARKGAAALLVNCSLPEAMPAALSVLREAGLPFGAYANGFTRITEGFLEDAPTTAALEARSDLTPEVYARHALAWVAAGARIIGGCCETTPAHIAAIKAALEAEGHSIV